MTVNVAESFKELLERNDKAIEIVSKRMGRPKKRWKRFQGKI